MKVEILSRKLITPASPTPPHLRTLKISSFDQIPAFSFYTASMYYYTADNTDHEHQDVATDDAERSKKLQKTLAEILTIYYPLGGRYNEEDASIDCNDEGAEFVEARASGSLSAFLEGEELETQSRNQFLPYILQAPNDPMLAVQFNMFECGGSVIGVCVSHRLADAYTALTFIDAWAIAVREGVDKVSSPNFELGSICPPRDVYALNTAAPKFAADDKEFINKRFVFNGLALEKLKAIANVVKGDGQSDWPKKHQPTRVEVVAALIYEALIRVSHSRNGRPRPSVLVFLINMRGRTTILPQNCCGTLLMTAVSQEFMPDVDGEKELQLHELASEVHNTITSGVAACAEASDAQELLLRAINGAKMFSEMSSRSDINLVSFDSWCRFPMYETDFGWGKPASVNSAYYATEVVFLVDSKDGKGIEAWVTLEEKSMLLFEQDPKIVEFSDQNTQRNLLGN